MKEQGSGSNKKIANNLLALSSAAVLTIYSVGYFRTKAAAERFAAPAAQRRTSARPAPVASAPAQPGSVAPQAIASAPFVPAAVAASPPATRDDPGHDDSDKTASRAVVARAPSVSVAAAKAPRGVGPTAGSERPTQTVVPPVSAATTPEPPSVADAAVAAPPVAPPPSPAPTPQWKDGMYSGWGFSRHGDIQATVVIEHGKVTAAGITQCLTRYPCSMIEHLPPQVVARQNPDVDYVSGATESADAFFDAVFEALGKAK